jgi:hypothetical protein
MVGCLLFVWLCTLRGDQQWREEKHTEPPAPEWARVLFVLVIGGMLMFCLAPGMMQGVGQYQSTSHVEPSALGKFLDGLTSRPPENWTVQR